MADHSPEPWTTRNSNEEGPHGGLAEFAMILAANADTNFDDIGRMRYEADARRIVACVNACADWSTEDLENGAVIEVERIGPLVAIDEPPAPLSPGRGGP